MRPAFARLFRRADDVQRLRQILGVVAIRLVEIADAREQQRFGILFFEREVLRDQRRGRELAQGRGQTAVPARPHWNA